MTDKQFSIVRLSEEKDPEIVITTLSHYEAKKRFQKAAVNFGEKLELRSFVEGKCKVVMERNNGYAG